MTRSCAGGFARAYIAPLRARQFIAAALILLSLAAHAEPLPVDVRPGLAYGPLPAEKCDLYLPAGGPAGRRPAIVMIHGGGWVGGSRATTDGMARLIASLGLVVLNIDYRLADPAQPSTRWPAQLLDAQLATRFLRLHAAEWEVDPTRIGAMGDSAGAHLALFLGALPHPVAGDVAALYPNQRPDVAAIVDQYGPTDLATMGSAAGSIQALFGTATPPPAALATTSPLGVITSHTAPVYILQGDADPIVPAQQSQRLYDTLRRHGVATTLILFHGGHGYEGVPDERIGALQSNAIAWLIRILR